MLSLLVVVTAYAYFSTRHGEPRSTGQDASGAAGSADAAAEGAERPEAPAPAVRDSAPAPPPVEVDTDAEIVRQAVGLFNSGDYEGAVRLLREIPEPDGKVLATIGLAYYKLGDYRSAVEYLEEAADRDDDFLVRKFLAIAYYRLDDLDRSLSNAEAGLSIQDDRELRGLYDKVKRELATQDGYVKEETLHFKVLFNGYEHGGLSRSIIGILEDAYRTIGQELNYFPSAPVTVILYTRKDFFDITRVPGWTGGIYDGKIRVPVKGLRGDEEVLRRVLFHEYTHALVHSITRNCPQWINEGLADYFSGGYSERVGQVIPLRSLEGPFLGLDRRVVGIAYRESYSAVSYLVDRYGLFRIKELLLSLSGGADLNEAFNSAFSISYDEFVSAWGRELD